MRTMIWIGAMLSDVSLAAAVVVVLTQSRGIGALALVALAAHAWRRSGGLDAWRPSVVRQFFRNAR